MKFKVNISHATYWLFSILVFFIYFAFPKSVVTQIDGDFRLISLYLQPWVIQRYSLILICIFFIAIIIARSNVLSNIQFIIVTAILTILGLPSAFNGNFIFLYSYVGLATIYLLNNNFKNYSYSGDFTFYLIALLFTVYILQFFVYRTGGRVVSSFLDPNISGFYLFLIYAYFRYVKFTTLAIVSGVVGLTILSRNFILAVVVFELLKINFVSTYLNKISILKSPFTLFFSSMIFVLIFSYSMVQVASVNETIGSSSDRITNIVDGSNYERAKANTDMIERIFKGEFILSGNGDGVDNDTEYRPHNAFLRAIYRYGLLISCVVFFVTLKIMKNITNKSFELVAGVFCYYALLNDFVTGLDIVLLFLIAIASSSYRNRFSKVNYTLKA